jgi:hypothetical protein
VTKTTALIIADKYAQHLCSGSEKPVYGHNWLENGCFVTVSQLLIPSNGKYIDVSRNYF